MKLNTLLSVTACAFSLLAAPLSHAQGLRVPGSSSSFGNDWRVGSSPGGASGYGSTDAGSSSTYGSPSNNSASRQYGNSPSSYGTPNPGSPSDTSNLGSSSTSGGSGLRPAQPVAPRSPGGGLRTN